MSRTFAALAIEVFHSYFSVTEFDLIVPVPMSNRRLLARGFNHSALIAARLSSQTKIPVERRALRKAKETPPQARLTRVERLKNVRGSFGIKRPENIRDRRILLVDDVATTGSTIAEASRLLIKKGKAESVDCLVLGLRISAGIDSAASTGDPPESGNDHQS